MNIDVQEDLSLSLNNEEDLSDFDEIELDIE